MPPVMTLARLNTISRRPPAIITMLSIAAILGFLAVTHLVNRFREQEKALARHLYTQGQMELDSGRASQAVEFFRAALAYNRDDFQYQLNLARALRDSGRVAESKSYLMNLWERAPEDGPVNLALGRLAVRERSTGDAIHYYHNAVYGIWSSDPDGHRRNAQFELIDFLLQQNAYPQADAELIPLAASLSRDSELETRVGKMFEQAGDYPHALSEYHNVLQYDRENVTALTGAGNAAFQLRLYGTASKYLGDAAKIDPRQPSTAAKLQIARSVIDVDPFLRRISSAERERRARLAFAQAGDRLRECGQGNDSRQDAGPSAAGQSEPPADRALPQDFALLQQQWLALKPKLSQPKGLAEPQTVSAVMDVVFRIEQLAQQRCGQTTEFDQALLLLSQDSEGADR